MSDFIAIDVNGLENLQALLHKLPAAIRGEVIDAVSEYLLNVYRAYPPYNYVSRKAAYGVTFFTDKQRRWFFAALKSGELSIPYRRTQTLRRGWHQIGQGENSLLVNETPYAAWMMGPGEQSRHAIAMGWKDIDKIAKEREVEIYRRADAAADRAIDRLD